MDNLAYQEEWREELIDGKIVSMAPPSMNHMRISSNLYRIFSNYLHGKECEPIADGAAVYLSDEDYYIPDFMVVCDPEKIQSDGVHGAPDLVAEVLSPSTAKADRGRKRDIYEKSGVREYWIVNPADKTIEQYFLQDGHFVLHDTYAIYPDWMLSRMKAEERAAVATEFKCSLYDDLVIHLDDVFYRVK